MLRILSLLLLSLVLLTTACSKDDPQPEPTLEGTWKLQRAYYRYYNADGTIAKDFDIPPTFTDETLTLKRDSIGFSRSLFGQERAWANPLKTISYTAPYTRQDQTLTIDLSTSNIYFTILELDGNSLEIEQSSPIVTSYVGGPTRFATGGIYTR
ncbi:MULTISPECIES: lipocalin family protein [Hymenobacter]|uniref:Lipocalin family protein n=2 Tax=Hymenobacter TaxID=89966 RepID=A0ABS6WY60_9BACT|nr:MULTISPECIES: lipocalin family protein [Hymenobacter]MBO3270729.1 lipocalin family protein [Hymenobacter defluvii]MBW3128540.1 lipocalin family protein [Hymenobacter profundi]